MIEWSLWVILMCWFANLGWHIGLILDRNYDEISIKINFMFIVVLPAPFVLLDYMHG